MLSSTTFRSCRLASQVISRRQPAVLVHQHSGSKVKDLMFRRLLTSNAKDGSPAKEGLKNEVINESGSSSAISQMWNRFIGPKEMPPRWTAAWYREMVLVCTVFAITGSSTMVLVRPAVSKGLCLEGNMRDGPWSYRICSLVIMTPIYASLLMVVGTVFGRHYYFRHFSVNMWSRFGIPPELFDATFHQTKKHFRKW